MHIQKKTEYILMNKDCAVLSFRCSRNEFDEPEFQELTWHVEDYRPIGYKSLRGFLERRKAPKHRQHIQRLLERYGCDDLEGFIRVTHAVSLNDTFWVKEADRSLTWVQISLYQNKFDQLISEAAFDGSFSSRALFTTSPEFGTDGNYAKCWIWRILESTYIRLAAAVMRRNPYLSSWQRSWHRICAHTLLITIWIFTEES